MVSSVSRIVEPSAFDVVSHVSSVLDVVPPLSPRAARCLEEGILDQREVSPAFGQLFVVEREAHHVWHRSVDQSQVELLRIELLMEVEALESVHLSVHGGDIFSRSDSDFFVAVRLLADLDKFSDEYFVFIARVRA